MALDMLINLEKLKKWTGYKSSAAIKNWLDSIGVRYFTTQSGEICTTEEAINDRLIGKSSPKTKIKFK
jgi:hypothetical protein